MKQTNKNNLDFSSNNKNIISCRYYNELWKELCEEGQQYFDSYKKNLLTVEGDEEDIERSSKKLICAEQ